MKITDTKWNWGRSPEYTIGRRNSPTDDPFLGIWFIAEKINDKTKSRAPAGPDGWQPIDTAPPDIDECQFWIGPYLDSGNYWEPNGRIKDGKIYLYSKLFRNYAPPLFCQPVTHWMLPPAAPIPEAG